MNKNKGETSFSGLTNLWGGLADIRGALPPQPPPPVATGLVYIKLCVYH